MVYQLEVFGGTGTTMTRSNEILGFEPMILVGILSSALVLFLISYSVYNDKDLFEELFLHKISTIGGILIIGSVFLPWVDIGFTSVSLIQLSELVNELGHDYRLFGVLLLIMFSGILAIFAPTTGNDLTIGFTKFMSFVLTIAALTSFIRAIFGEGGSISFIGFGLYVALVGGFMVLISRMKEGERDTTEKLEWISDE